MHRRNFSLSQITETGNRPVCCALVPSKQRENEEEERQKDDLALGVFRDDEPLYGIVCPRDGDDASG